MKPKILIIDDEIHIVELIRFNLETSGYEVDIAYDGLDGYLKIKENAPQLVLLDWMLPNISGIDMLKKIRNDKSLSDIPVIMLTAKNMESDKIEGLELGADDYITKPFEIREVLARVQVQLRHKEEKEAEEQHTLSFKDMLLNRDTFQVEIAGKILPKITKQEFAILELLLRNPKQVFSKEDIFEYAWDEPYIGVTKTLDVHISTIR